MRQKTKDKIDALAEEYQRRFDARGNFEHMYANKTLTKAQGIAYDKLRRAVTTFQVKISRLGLLSCRKCGAVRQRDNNQLSMFETCVTCTRVEVACRS